MLLTAGDHLGPYEILAPIGAGGMGEVYRARDTRLGREVALKVLPASLVNDPERQARFTQEARAASALNHPNIVTVYDIGRENGVPFIVSELIHGESLRPIISQGPTPVRRLADIGSQIADGLAAAHAAGITHRDLKPENIMVTPEGRAKILDFGLAKITAVAQDDATVTQGMETKAGVILGTFAYMSPEQLRAQPVDHRTDIFSFGVILYEMLTGKRAFTGATSADLVSAILKDDPPEPASGVPPAAMLVVRRCLEKERTRRFQSASDLAFALRSMTTVTSAIGEAEAPVKNEGRRVAWSWLAGSVLAVAAIAAGAGYWFGSHVKPPQPPKFRSLLRLTQFNGNFLGYARFLPDGKGIVYSGELGESRASKIYTGMLDRDQPKEIPLPEGAILFAISSQHEIAGGLRSPRGRLQVLFRAPLSGGGARQIIDGVHSADWSPDGTELAVNREVGDRDRIEYPIGHLLFEATSDVGLRNCRVSRDGNRVAFVENGYTEDVIRVVDRKGEAEELARFPRGGGFFPSPISWSPDGLEIWFSAFSPSEPDAIYAVGLNRKLRLLTRLPNRPVLLDVSPEGKVILSNGASIGRSLLHTPADSYPADEVHPSVFTPDGRYYSGSTESKPYFGRTDGSAPIQISKKDGYGVPSPDGKWMWIFGLDRSVWIAPTGLGEERRVNLDQFDVKSVVVGDWFSDSRRVLISIGAPGKPPAFYAFDITDSSLKQLPTKHDGGEIDHLFLSPDDQWILSGHASTTRIRRVSGGDPQPIPGLLPTDAFRGWTDDSKSIWVTDKFSADVVKLYRLNIITGDRRFSRELKASGTGNISVSMMSADGRTYETSEHQAYSSLTLMEGLK